MHQRLIAKKYARNDQAKQVGWQNCLAFGCRGETAEKEKNK